MPGTLVIGYGAYGCKCARTYSDSCSRPVLLVDNHEFDGEESSFLMDRLILGEDTTLNESRLRNVLSGYSSVLLVSSVGGDSFGEAYGLISECARMQEITMVSLCTVPFAFETERRSRAFEILPAMSPQMRNMFVIDLQNTIREDCNPAEFFDATQTFICSTLDLLVKLLEQSPFFSLCSDPMYTLSLGRGVAYSESVRVALEHPYFNVPSHSGKVLICSSKSPNAYEIEQAQSSVMTVFRALPEMITYNGLENDQVLLFIPISFQSE